MNYTWKPHPGAQTDFLSRGEFEVLFGGQAGPGKTDCLIADATRYVFHPKYRGLLTRRTFPKLQEVIDRCHAIYPSMGAVYKSSEHRWYFPSGAIITLAHMQHEESKYDHQGKEYQFVGFDELTQFLESQYKYLFSRLRSTDDAIQPYIRSSTNPGGIGHAWVKERWKIGVVNPGTVIVEELIEPITGEVFTRERVFISAKAEDNPTLFDNDPFYIGNLLSLPELERNRLLYGIWDAFEGQAFPELNAGVHEFNFDIPLEWERFGSFDWGYSKPYIYSLYAVDFDGVVYKYAELYGAKEEDGKFKDEGLRQNDGELASRIHDFEREWGIPRYRVADPAIWNKRPVKGNPSGPSVEENLANEKLFFIKADNDRIHGRREFHNRLCVDEDTDKPMFMIHKRCKGFWQTIPELKEAENNPEDIEQKNVADHIYDETRYALMSRPLRAKKAKRGDAGSFQDARRKLIKAKQIAQARGISLESAYRSS